MARSSADCRTIEAACRVTYNDCVRTSILESHSTACIKMEKNKITYKK